MSEIQTASSAAVSHFLATRSGVESTRTSPIGARGRKRRGGITYRPCRHIEDNRSSSDVSISTAANSSGAAKRARS
jgi:hypothetical protein